MLTVMQTRSMLSLHVSLRSNLVSRPPSTLLHLSANLRFGSSHTRPKQRPARPLPPLNEDELEETWVRGSGPGGQSINKTNISCSLIHKPTGLRVQNHETRSRMLNAKLARRRLQERLDLLFNPGSSRLEQKWDRERQKKAAKARKGRRRQSTKGLDVDAERAAPEGDDAVQKSTVDHDQVPSNNDATK